MKPLISVIIPVWNGEKYVKEAIESALLQDYENKEIIVVNDGSTDQTEKILSGFGHSIKVLYQENKGLGASRNLAIRVSKGDYLAFLDHDDCWEKTKLSTQIEVMLAAKEQDPLVFSKLKQFICTSLTEQEKAKVLVNQEELSAPLAGTLLISKKRFYEIGPFLEEKQVGEFMDWYLKALEAKTPMVMLDQVTLRRRIHQDNMGRQKTLYSRKGYLSILKASLDRRKKAQEAL